VKSGLDYFSRAGLPLDMEQWNVLWEQKEYRTVGNTTLADSTIVSTVWLGLAHGERQGQPVIFETMVFNKTGEPVETKRYCTEAEALVGHDQAVAAWKLIVE